MPDEVTIRLQYNDNGQLFRCQAPSFDVPAGSSPLAHIATTVAGWTTFQGVCVSRETLESDQFNTLSRENRSFLYMDVGRWGGPSPGNIRCVTNIQHREFGIVCGGHAVLCDFLQLPPRPPRIQNRDPSALLIETLLQDLCRGRDYTVEITKWATINSSAQPPMAPIHSSARPSVTPIYVFLGDLHLPILKELPSRNRVYPTAFYEEPMGRVRGLAQDPYTPLNMNNELVISEWYRNYLYGDIFRGGGDSLLAFLTLLEQSRVARMIHFIQVGDLYDLWIGLAPFFQPVPGPPGEVRLRDAPDLTARSFIDYWIRSARNCYPALVTKLDNLDVGRKTFLYGNHDNYLARHSAGMPSRQRFLRESGSGLHVEHGHWVDSSNYDGGTGATGGHRMTDYVFGTPTLRSVDPQRRHFYTTASAIEYVNRRDFGIFVMGHTHMPYLTKVQVQVQVVTPVAAQPPPPPRVPLDPTQVPRDAGV
jgi:hypothetical protein